MMTPDSPSKGHSKQKEANESVQELLISRVKSQVLPLFLKLGLPSHNIFKTINASEVEELLVSLVSDIQRARDNSTCEILGIRRHLEMDDAGEEEETVV